jgi:hypothetical protein
MINDQLHFLMTQLVLTGFINGMKIDKPSTRETTDLCFRMSREARRAARRRHQNKRRRIETLVIKAHELWNDYGVAVAIILNDNIRYWTYRSKNDPTWPPSLPQIVSDFPFAHRTTNSTLGNTHPIPKNLLPRDVEKKLARRRIKTRNASD